MESSIEVLMVNTEKLMKAFESESPVIKKELAVRCKNVTKDLTVGGARDEKFLNECIEELIYNNVQTNAVEKEEYYWLYLSGIMRDDMYDPEPNRHWEGLDPTIFYRLFNLFSIENLRDLKMPVNGGYPTVFSADRRWMEENIQKVKDALAQSPEVYGIYPQEAIDELFGWMNKSRKYACDLIIFYYHGY